jgi:TatD DNase family protein
VNLTDTHCHLDLEKFDLDRADVLSRAQAEGVARILIPGLALPSSRRAVELAGSHPMLFAAIGVHPNDSLSWDENSIGALRQLFLESNGLPFEKPREQSPALHKIVAIGEIGLDYYWDDAPHPHQQLVLKEQLALAAELKLPVVLHLREAGDASDGECAWDLLQILEEWAGRLRVEKNPLVERPGVLHSFSGSHQTADKVLDLNFYIGITGPVTYKNAEAKRQVVASLPLDKILIETDAPFLAPVPQRGRRNEPAFVRHIADKIAEIHSTTREQVAEITTNNAARLFGWGG